MQSLSDPDKADMDFLDIFRDPASTSIGNEFATVDDKTGEKTLNESGSAGVRMKLLLHAGQCFLDSKGLGVGILVVAVFGTVLLGVGYWRKYHE